MCESEREARVLTSYATASYADALWARLRDEPKEPLGILVGGY